MKTFQNFLKFFLLNFKPLSVENSKKILHVFLLFSDFILYKNEKNNSQMKVISKKF